MDADTFIDTVVARIEQPDETGVSLADRLRQSHDPEWGTWNGSLVNDITNIIEEIIAQTPEEDVKCAWNEIAESEGCEPLQENESRTLFRPVYSTCFGCYL